MDNKEKLKGMILDMFPDLAEDNTVKVEEVKEEISNLKAQNTELKAKIEAIENSPMQKGNVMVPGSNRTVEVNYKNHYVPGQGEMLKLYHTPEKQEILAKSYIDFVDNIVNNGQASMRKALNESTATEGSEYVFDEYVNEILAFARLTSFGLQHCRVVNVSSDKVHFPNEAGSVTVKFKAETVAAEESNPGTGETLIEPERLTAYSTVTNELLADSAFDITSWLTSLFSEAVGQKIDSEVLNGAGTTASPFAGLANDALIVDSTGDLGIAHLTDIITKLPVNKSVGAQFLMHRLAYKEILGLTDTAGNAIYPPSVATPNSLYGYPVILAEAAPSTITNGNPVGYFGNWKNYIIGMRKTMGSLDIDIFGKFLEYMTRMRCVMRVHGACWNASGFVKMVY